MPAFFVTSPTQAAGNKMAATKVVFFLLLLLLLFFLFFFFLFFLPTLKRRFLTNGTSTNRVKTGCLKTSLGVHS